MKAIVAFENTAVLQIDRPIPKLSDDCILIKTNTIALNPTDWKQLHGHFAGNGALLGSDFAGTIVDVGRAVTKNWSKGDRVAGVTKGGFATQPEDGAFAEYIVAKGDIQIKIPDHLSFEEAATLPLGVATVMQGFYQKGLKMNLPADPTKQQTFLLIYGGSTAAGALGIQYAKLSPSNFAYVKSLGADEVFNSREENLGSKIRVFTQDRLKLAWDIRIMFEQQKRREDVESIGTNMYTIYGEDVNFGTRHIPACSEEFERPKEFAVLTEKSLAEGNLSTHKVRSGKDGLRGAIEGLDELNNDQVGGEKLVYIIAETV